jgi:hypothetical protein
MHPPWRTKPNQKKKKKGPGSLTDTENKTRQKKKKNKGPGSLTDTENKTHQKKQKKRSVLARAVPGQTDTHVTLIYKMAHFYPISFAQSSPLFHI